MSMFVVFVYARGEEGSFGKDMRNISLKIRRDFKDSFFVSKVPNTYKGSRERRVGYGFVLRYGKCREDKVKWIMENYGKYSLSIIDGNWVEEKAFKEEANRIRKGDG
jgi:hypothetical protein